ncbi:hypothetical protein [Turneriella parva]|uniref:Uncharacterized protein n=1 Tax=Turneriella parva (strain ATCC BAA-1111 / DSM 21527 / NCTC 11395 / H) TaxID=869212 RepID=I4B833_TURPD|nr:hypothetical protein [Turneriella parva]AFM13440.1 hypothetical protein Turpa_2801 [Turneriella parva DSM 21527]
MKNQKAIDKELYSILQSKETDQLHIFISYLDAEKKCAAEDLSICEKMFLSDQGKNHTQCQNAAMTRAVAAKIGWPVCGTCVSHLYADY